MIHSKKSQLTFNITRNMKTNFCMCNYRNSVCTQHLIDPLIKNPSDLDCPGWDGVVDGNPLSSGFPTLSMRETLLLRYFPHTRYTSSSCLGDCLRASRDSPPLGASQIWAIPKASPPPSSKFQRLCPPIFRSNPPASDSPTGRTFCLLIAFCNILFRWPVGQALVNCGEFQSNRAIGLALVARAIWSWSGLTETFLLLHLKFTNLSWGKEQFLFLCFRSYKLYLDEKEKF